MLRDPMATVREEDETHVAADQSQPAQADEKSRAESSSTVRPTEQDLVKSLKGLLTEHELDQNFPRDVLARARQYLARRAAGDADADAAQRLVDDFCEYKELALNSSAYVEVRAVVDTTDDASLPVATFRVLLMGTLFAVAGTAMHQFFSLRMPSIALSTYVVQLVSMPLGVWMARWLPARRWGHGRLSFTLNPGPFNQKEHLLVAMMANVAFGSHHNGAYIVSIIQVLKLERFYGEKVLANSVSWQIATLIATQLMGYGCAGLTRRFLVYPPAMIWQRPLANIALTKALARDQDQSRGGPVAGWTMSRYRFFCICFGAMFFWFVVPNYLFQALALFNWPTWLSPGNVTLAIIAGSTCGLGLNPLPTLDWNTATLLGDPIVTPLFTLLNFACGMAVMGFVVAPVLYFNNVWNGGYLPINSNKVYDNTGAFYDIHRILKRDMTFDEAAYRAYSIPWLSTTMLLNSAAFFSLYVAVPVHVALWFRRDIKAGLRSIWSREPRCRQFRDVHNRLMSAYPECPHWWYLLVLGASFGLACVSVTAWPTGMPIWGIALAVVFTIVLQIPIGMLAAITNVEVPTSILAMLIGGYALEGKTVPNMIFKMFSFMSTSQSLCFVADLKMAHYAKIPPRWAFAAQVYATFIAGFVALGVNHWSLRNIEGVCVEGQAERFTCPSTHSFFMSSVLWGVVGPRRLFGSDGPYRALTYFVPIGLVLPIVVYLLARRWPTSWWRNVNAPIFLAGPLGWAPYNWSYMQGAVVLAIFFNHFIKRRYRAWWEKYAYVLTSSFAAATGVAALVLFFGLQKWDIRIDWWGNQVAARGVDQGGWMARDGSRVKCAHLKLPKGGAFGSGF
ncbi:hypothetical protein HIM_04215 [Hirsutella minnesotensis 3608]|uniref:Sexual differentiation process protein isp4 n=1 Tax=Hirsutella minnesotensis 3608 TaxID=1043627 RepID=A0A0F7ZLJ8_9HYPO|nr:hypothetical protein HIM_04215 [Hirsutella minnesotensis 3608]